jgi:hypothetical protein
MAKVLSDGRGLNGRSKTPLHDDAIECLLCRDEGEKRRLFNSVGIHLKKHGITVRDYRLRYPEAPTSSENVKGHSLDSLLDQGPLSGKHFWTPDSIIRALRNDAKRRARAPTFTEWKQPSKGLPSMQVLQDHFGSFNGALQAAGLTTRRRGKQLGARMSHCRRGHEFTPENTVLRVDGGRQCRTCLNASRRRSYAKD